MKYVDSDREQVALAEEGNGRNASAHCGKQRALITLERARRAKYRLIESMNGEMRVAWKKRQRSSGKIETLCKMLKINSSRKVLFLSLSSVPYGRGLS